jgi:hypothetical protein
MRTTRIWLTGLPVGLVIAFAVATVPAGAASVTTERTTVSSSGEQGNGTSFQEGPSGLSPDGRFVTFDSEASNLVSGDTNGFIDAFVRDLSTGQTTRVSVSSTGEQGNDESNDPVSVDGNLVAFDSFASNLVAGDTNRDQDVFVRNLTTGETTRVSLTSDGKQGQGQSFFPSLSDDGRLLLFDSVARLVPEDTNKHFDVYAHDLVTGKTTLVSTTSAGGLGDGDSFDDAAPSADHRFVTFNSDATNLVPGDTNGALDVFVHDLVTGQTTRVSVSSSGEQGDGNSDYVPVISANGRFVAFSSAADNLVRNDTNGFPDLFVRDLKTGKTTLLSKSPTGDEGNNISRGNKGISSDGRFVAYQSFASNLVPGDTNGTRDIFLTDRETGQTVRVNVSTAGAQADGPSFNTSLSEDGAWVGFSSDATNLVPEDTNGASDGFVRGPFG